MKRKLLAVLYFLPFLLAVSVSAQTPTPLVLNKAGTGIVTRESLSVELQSQACDATAEFLPDGTRLVSDRFTAVYDDRGVGFFRGAVKFVRPDGTSVAAGIIQGTIGLAVPRPENAECIDPGRWQGVITPAPTAITTDQGGTVKPDRAGSGGPSTLGPEIVRSVTRPADGSPWLIHFVADAIEESASPVPLFRVRLEGLMTAPGPPNPEPKIVVQPGKLAYRSEEPVQATVVNNSTVDIQTVAFNSYCTILQLQRQVEGEWVTTHMCPLTGGPVVVIKAGQTYPVMLPPDATLPATKVPGVYRLALTFQAVAPDGTPPGPERTVFSVPFTVGPTDPPTGQVVLASAKPAYSLTEPIVGVLKNGMNVPIRVYDLKSFCTILELQKRTADGWVMLYGCPLDRMPLPVFLQPGEPVAVRMPNGAMDTHRWEPGEYRFKTAYAPLRADGSYPDDETAVFSEPFRIGEIPPPTGRVALSPARPAYTTTDPIHGVLKNGMNVPIRVFDLKSFCTILELQKRVGDAWTMIAPCPLKRLPIPVYLQPGEVSEVRMPDAWSENFKWEPGEYRFMTAFAPQRADGTWPDAETPIYSEPFLITEAPPPPARVAVAPDKLTYLPGELVAGVVHNGWAEAIQSRRNQSFCTVLRMERQVEGVWTPMYLCDDTSATTQVVEAGATVKIGLPEATIPEFRYEPGTYRLAYRFWPADPSNPYVETTVFSAPFTIQSAPPLGRVTVAPSQLRYAPGQNVIGVIENASDQTFVTLSLGSWCTILSLFRLEGDRWVKQGVCASFWEGPPVPIPAHSVMKVELPPDTSPSDLPSGRYRLELRFWKPDAAGKPAGETLVAISEAFYVEGVSGIVQNAR